MEQQHTAMARTSGSCRDYCFTLFIDEDEDKLAVWCCPAEAFDQDNDLFKYAVWQIEKAPSTGRLHVQGFLQLKKQLGMARTIEVGSACMHFMPCMR